MFLLVSTTYGYKYYYKIKKAYIKWVCVTKQYFYYWSNENFHVLYVVGLLGILFCCLVIALANCLTANKLHSINREDVCTCNNYCWVNSEIDFIFLVYIYTSLRLTALVTHTFAVFFYLQIFFLEEMWYLHAYF